MELSETRTLTASLLTVQVEVAPTAFPTHPQLLHHLITYMCSADQKHKIQKTIQREPHGGPRGPNSQMLQG